MNRIIKLAVGAAIGFGAIKIAFDAGILVTGLAVGHDKDGSLVEKMTKFSEAFDDTFDIDTDKL